jgi:trk system potassium uptake protein TrkA
MKILIVGAGAVGYNLARMLAVENHDVAIVEENHARVRRIRDKLDVRAVAGSGASPEVLQQAGISDAELVIAVTERDEVNLIVCTIAKGIGVPQVIARVRSPEYSSERSVFRSPEMGIDYVINPIEITVESIAKIIRTPGATEVADFAGGAILLCGFHVPEDSGIAGKKLAQFKGAQSKNAFLIAAIARGDELIIPGGKDEIRAGDDIYVVVAREYLAPVAKMITREDEGARNIVLFDSGDLSMQLARRLQKELDQIVVIEPDQERAERACARIPRGLVLCGEPTDTEVLREAQIDRASFFMGLSDRDDLNLLSSLFAKKHGARRTMVLTNEPDFVPVIGSIGIDVVINPRLLTVGEILRFIRKGHIVSVVSLREDKAEALELVADPGSKVVGKELSKIKLPRNCLIGAIEREGAMLIPSGDSMIRAGETVIVFALTSAIEKVEKLFSG